MVRAHERMWPQPSCRNSGWKQKQRHATMHVSEVLYINLTWYSWWVPGRKPGTSTKVTRGMLKASQKRMNLCHGSSHRYS